VLHDQAPAVIDIDLAGVASLDVTGIGALAAVYNTAVRFGRQLRVIHPQPIVRRVLEAAGLLGVLTAADRTAGAAFPESGYRSAH
jgi:anti-anti-sigma factor